MSQMRKSVNKCCFKIEGFQPKGSSTVKNAVSLDFFFFFILITSKRQKYISLVLANFKKINVKKKKLKPQKKANRKICILIYVYYH